MPAERLTALPRPSRTLSRAISAALVAIWVAARVGAVKGLVFPLTYALPLLLCIWTCDTAALWSMAAAFIALQTAIHLWLSPPAAGAGAAWHAHAAAVLGILGVSAVVHLIIRLREANEAANERIHAQAAELRAQGEELAEQNEELVEQSEEASQQAEELARQNEEIQALNQELSGRERLLQRLLDTARHSGGEEDALAHVIEGTIDLFGEAIAAVVVYERDGASLRIRASAGLGGVRVPESVPGAGRFASLVIAERRTAALADSNLRPDLTILGVDGVEPPRAILASPLLIGGTASGALAVYSRLPCEWTQEQFRLCEWLAGRCAQILETLRLQNDLREAERRKDVFLATLSHELRNPLAPMRFALDLLRRGHRVDEAIDVLERQLGLEVRLVDELLDLTRIQSDKIQLRRGRVGIDSIVERAVEAARPAIEASGHALAVDVPADELQLDADADRVVQALTNLLNNAARYTPSPGRITVSAGRDGDSAVIAVADTGIGVASEDLDRIFEMFTQVGGPGQGGLGIGLALVRRIVELHGGSVTAHSEGRGRGTRFALRLPLAAETRPAEPSLTPSLASTGVGSCRRVLVVDDNLDAAEMVKAVLESAGHVVEVAHDAGTALARLDGFDPEVALLDIGLPDMDGYELARRLRGDERCRDAYLVAVTGWGQEQDRQRARDAGFAAHLTKPADPDALRRLVARLPR